MIFSAFIGAKEYSEKWKTQTANHARWLNLLSSGQAYDVHETHRCMVEWLVPQGMPKKPNIHVSSKELTTDTWGGLASVGTPISIQIDLRTGAFSTTLPPATPEQLCYVLDTRGIAVANDARLLARWAGSEINANAVYALFDFRAIPPPLTIYKNVHRIPNGHHFKWVD